MTRRTFLQSLAAVAASLAGSPSLPKLWAAIRGRHFVKDSEGRTNLPAGDWDSVTVKRGTLVIADEPGHIERLDLVGGLVRFDGGQRTITTATLRGGSASTIGLRPAAPLKGEL